MTYARIKQLVLRTGGILLLGSIFFLLEQISFGGILYGADPLPSTVTPFRYKIEPPPKEASPTTMTDAQSQPEQQAVSTTNSPPIDSPNSEHPTTAADHSADDVEPPESVAGDKLEKERVKAASKSPAGSRSKNVPLSPNAPVISSSSKKILGIESDLTSPSAEMITIVLTGIFPPVTQVIEGKTPKIVCDFPDVLLEKTIKRIIPVNGRYILQIRTGIHPPPEPKTRVVLDLAPSYDYEVEQLFYEKDNRYSMIIREKP